MTLKLVPKTPDLHLVPAEPIFHFCDPTDETKTWCGRPGIGKTRDVRNEKEISCVVCLDLWKHYGSKYWWDLYNTHGPDEAA